MALPDLTFRIAFATAPLAATPTWTTVADSKLLGFVSERGRSSERDEFQPGTATVTLDNRDRAYDPANTSSAHSGSLKPRKRASMQATFNAITYDLFDGHVKRWPQTWEGLYGKCPLELTDAFEMFARETIASDGARAQERSDQRVAWVLDQIGWPAGKRTLGTGRVDVQAHDFDAYNALQHLREVEKAESGFFFMDGAGNAVFQHKYKRLEDYTTSQATFSDSPTGAELPIASFERAPAAVEDVINHVTGKKVEVANPESVRVFSWSDATSRTDYGPAAITFESWAASETEVEAKTMALVDFYKQPTDRVTSITIEPQSNDLLWPQALGRVIGERITVKGRFFNKGSVLTQESRIEGIRHEYQAEPLRWTTTFRLSPVFPQELAGYWLLGTSVLGSTTVPAW